MLDQFEFISGFLSQAAQTSLGEKIIVVMVVWFFMGRKVAEHFKGLEKGMADGFKGVREELLELRLAITHVETDHSNRLGKIETNMNQFDDRIGKLEKGVENGRN
jgi:hypothetical protein